MIVVDLIRDTTCSRRWFWRVGLGVLLLECVLNAAIILRVGYTEIDWVAYMQEVAGVFEEGQLDYRQLRGDTGPLVYPAGFVYLYQLLSLLTSGGANVRLAQWVFAALHIAVVATTIAILGIDGRVPPWMLLLLSASKRVHSIYVLRLFNDCWAVLFLLLAVFLFLRQRWNSGCIFFSLAVSVKMSVLLYAPALFLLLVRSLGLLGSFVPLSICAAIQLLLGLPFLLSQPWSYLAGSFDLGRTFQHIWTVNWKFLPEPFFLSPAWSLLSLSLHAVTLLSFAHFRWTAQDGGLWRLMIDNFSARSAPRPIAPRHVAETLFVCNFVGIVFARSLHYQFYSWYFHTLPLLLFIAHPALHSVVAAVVFVVIEICWNTFPSTPISSFLLFASHVLLLAALWSSPVAQSQMGEVDGGRKGHDKKE